MCRKILRKRKKPAASPELIALRKRMNELFEGKPDAAFEYDLSFDNKPVLGAVSLKDGIIYRALSGGELAKFELSELEDISYVNCVGCCAVEYKSGGTEHELCRSGMKSSRTMQYFVKRAKAAKEGTDPGEPEKLTCEKCGKPLPRGSSICPRCVDKRRLFARLLPFTKPYALALSLVSLLLLAITGINMLLPKINAAMVDGFIGVQTPTGTVGEYLLLVLAMAGCGLINAIFGSVRRILATKAGNGVLVDIRSTLYAKIQELSLAGIMRKSAGELIQRITSDTNELREFLANTLPDLIQQCSIILGVGTIMFVTDWKLSLLVLLPIPAFAMLFMFTRRFIHRMYHWQWNVENEAGSLLHDVFSGMRVVKVFGTEDKEEARFNRAARRVADVSKHNELVWNTTMPFVNFLFTFGEYAVLLFVGSAIISGQEGYTLGKLIEFTGYIGIIYGPIRWMCFMPRRIARTTVSLTKVFDIIDEQPEISNCEQPIQAVENGNIEFKNVFFGYNNYESVLKDINLTINKGEMIGIVGRSGVGKTTMINLIMRLYDVSSGELLIDGKNIKDYDQHALRSSIGAVLQETFLFKGTIYSNIVYTKPDATKEEVIRAAVMANAHEFIMKQPDGYDTYVGEGGYTLSGGERQRIAIARAILRNPQILILDEATSALDTETERQIQDALAKLISGRTTIAIAHRLSTLRNATKLVVLDGGAIEEIGTHDELMANKGRYYKLVMAQREMSKLAGEVHNDETNIQQ